ncbi:lysophospholipid acyltransferase family protein [Bizionia sp. KMM 8389]
MKKIWLYSVRFYIKLGLFFYYRRIHVRGVSHVPKQAPVLLVSNHNNALLDALLIATNSGRFSYFLTRASVFKKPLVNAILRSLNMLPVYRVRDGWNRIGDNHAVFESCIACLADHEAVALFPEGNHHINRTVRPLSKGFTRLVFDTLEHYPDTDLKLVPIGLSYKQADAFADTVLLNFGAVYDAQWYLKADRHVETRRLKTDIWTALTKLTVHIPAELYGETIEVLDAQAVDYLNPEGVNACLASNLEACPKAKKPKYTGLKSVFKFLMCLLLIGPYAIWKGVAVPQIKEVEFVGTFRFGVAISLVPLWLFLVGGILAGTLGIGAGLLYVVLTLLVSLLAVKL